MSLDPVHWPPRVQVVALLLVVITWLLASAAGPAVGPVAYWWYAVAHGVFGALSWRYRELPWRDIASWTIPLLVWMAALVVVPPEPLLALVGLLIAGGWLGLFACWSPVVPWWYATVLRRPIEPNRTSHSNR
jgi:hypothetical protein